MTTYVEFLAHKKRHPGKETPTGKENYDSVQDFINFAKDRKLSILVTDLGDVIAVGESIIAHLRTSSHKDIDLIEKTFKGKVHWPSMVSGYDVRVEPRLLGKAINHFVMSGFHDFGLVKGRRKKPWFKKA